MNKNIKTLLCLSLLLVTTVMTSCLKKGLPDYPEWDGTNIDNVYVEYRFNGPDQYGGQSIVAIKKLDVVKTVDAPNSTIKLAVTVPAASGSFSIAERAKVAQNNLWVYLDISTAATIKPLAGTPKLGDPTNLTVPQQYEVTAANGTKKTWTIVVTSFNKP
ncbi:DUF5018-related domain-containing protein [Pedobacter gandavensis]|uniref:DUF5018 domain-containing protein n=1 Tax=Pedobacter gandavensis TaxID=2679963 RepID=A0ABR6ERL6_9SPHI|nr:hypothetical protein [Pedobacter gandavensis]MBB2147905.1 hypothetical protein [Pedobacter gandavensis]